MQGHLHWWRRRPPSEPEFVLCRDVLKPDETTFVPLRRTRSVSLLFALHVVLRHEYRASDDPRETALTRARCFDEHQDNIRAHLPRTGSSGCGPLARGVSGRMGVALSLLLRC